MSRLFTIFIAAAVAGASLCASEISISEYRSRLGQIQKSLDEKNLADAKREARNLDGATVTSNGAKFKADTSVLQPIENASSIDDATALKPRIKSILEATAENAASENAAEPNTDLLNKLRRDEDVALPPRDGQVNTGDIENSGIFYEFARLIGNGLKWILEKLEDFFKWLGKLLPSPKQGSGNVGGFVNYVIVIAAVLVALFVLRAYLKRRKFKAVAPAESAAPIASAKDADPLSRGSDEWEEYALQLAASGRYREAIRAWYHAALVLLFRSGLLSYRKGRTNWEYCYSLSQDVASRRSFQELTGVFESEWYGKSDSTADQAGEYGNAAKQFLSKTRAGRVA